jgi:hypothetical protein
MKKLLLSLAALLVVGCSGQSSSSEMGKSKAASADFQRLIDQSLEELRAKTATHDAAWSLGEASWEIDQDAGEIVFTSPAGLKATCPVQIIGTYNQDDSTWLWGWEHPSVDAALQEHAKRVREYGQKHGIEALTTKKLHCTEEEAWELTALACKLCEAQGAYRGPSGSTLVFVTFGQPKLSN